jgi:nitrile hydratase
MPDETPDPAQHDLGGNPRFRCVPVEPESDPPMSDFDRRVDAVRAVLREKGHLTTDEQRLHIEGLPERDYFGLTYYEKWLRSVSAIALAKGLVTWDEIS